MEFFSAVALMLLTLVGYSSGSVLGGRGRKITPSLLDPVIVVALWAGVLYYREDLGKWRAILCGLLVGILVGLVTAVLRRRSWPVRSIDSPSITSEHAFQKVWRRWKAFAVQMGNFQSRILLTLFYFIIVTPFGLLVRLFSDPLQMRRSGQPPLWAERPASDAHLEDARRQF
jgi:hypothetical protein